MNVERVRVLEFVQLPAGCIFRCLDEERAGKLIAARIHRGIKPLDFLDEEKPDALGRFEVLRKQRIGFKAGEELELSFRDGLFGRAAFRRHFEALPFAEQPAEEPKQPEQQPEADPAAEAAAVLDQPAEEPKPKRRRRKAKG